MTQYYYLVASLPMLFFGDTPPFNSHAWLDLCREQISENDYTLLKRIGFDALHARSGDHAAWQDYASWETALRNELALQRAQRLGLDAKPFLREAPFFAGLEAVAKEALGTRMVRVAESTLDRKRWSRLDELETGTQFDLGRLVVYRLKLLLLERNNRFRPEPGRDAFQREYAEVLDNAAAWTGSPQSGNGY